VPGGNGRISPDIAAQFARRVPTLALRRASLEVWAISGEEGPPELTWRGLAKMRDDAKIAGRSHDNRHTLVTELGRIGHRRPCDHQYRWQRLTGHDIAPLPQRGWKPSSERLMRSPRASARPTRSGRMTLDGGSRMQRPRNRSCFNSLPILWRMAKRQEARLTGNKPSKWIA
jgi:hypothetical protein